MKSNCHQLINRLNRIQGQINKLKEYLENNAECEKISHLSTSTIKSLDSFKASLIEQLIQQKRINSKTLLKLIQA